MQVIARIGRLQVLNGSSISGTERKEAEVQFLREGAGEGRNSKRYSRRRQKLPLLTKRKKYASHFSGHPLALASPLCRSTQAAHSLPGSPAFTLADTMQLSSAAARKGPVS